LATIEELQRHALPQRAARLAPLFEARLRALHAFPAVRNSGGRGLLWGLRLRDARAAGAVVRGALRRGLVLLQAGVTGDGLSISPPLVISEDEVEAGFEILEAAVAAIE
ncbi:MAG TPA: aminotransferase class III-fold pyridoxal phosphate-dependent enzyme, partial [Candidatus Tumulicola sp.]|nr:aminotransferase class III-fold pyridoxal phosphate-dependent enzyme [Candidatus Tumulicola sp.]